MPSAIKNRGNTKPQTAGRRSDPALTDKQWRFVEEYCVDLNAKEAGLRAGYTQANAGSKLLAIPEVVAAIKQRLGDRARETRIEAQRVLLEIARVAFFDPKGIFDGEGNLQHVKDMPEEVRRCIASVEVETRREKGTDDEVTTAKIKFNDKMRALEMLGKHLALFGVGKEEKHIHLHGSGNESNNPYLNAPAELITQGQALLHSLRQSQRSQEEEASG